MAMVSRSPMPNPPMREIRTGQSAVQKRVLSEPGVHGIGIGRLDPSDRNSERCIDIWILPESSEEFREELRAKYSQEFPVTVRITISKHFRMEGNLAWCQQACAQMHVSDPSARDSVLVR